MLNRRNLIRSAAGLLVAAGAGELLLPERRVWTLDQTMLGPGGPDNYGPAWWDRILREPPPDFRVPEPPVGGMNQAFLDAQVRYKKAMEEAIIHGRPVELPSNGPYRRMLTMVDGIPRVVMYSDGIVTRPIGW